MKENRLYIPPSLRADILEKLHEGHLGIVKCRARARETVWWPGISSQIKSKVDRCDICIKYRTPPVEALISSEIPKYPWQIVGSDLFEVHGKTYMVVTDYFSRYIEVIMLSSETSKEVILKLKSIMGRWGIPEKLRSDNGPCY